MFKFCWGITSISCFVFKRVLIFTHVTFQGALDLSDVHSPPKSPEGKTGAHTPPSKVSGPRLLSLVLVRGSLLLKVLFMFCWSLYLWESSEILISSFGTIIQVSRCFKMPCKYVLKLFHQWFICWATWDLYLGTMHF